MSIDTRGSLLYLVRNHQLAKLMVEVATLICLDRMHIMRVSHMTVAHNMNVGRVGLGQERSLTSQGATWENLTHNGWRDVKT